MSVQRSGKIVIGGAGLVGGVSRDFAVVRCLENGTLDPTFGTAGTAITDISGAYNEQVYAMVQGPDDSILLGGYYRDDIAMVRYLPEGTLDPSFGNGGKVFTTGSLATDKQINALALLGDGRIIAVGESTGSNNTDVVVARYSSNGQPDSTFGTGGRTYTAIGSGTTPDRANSVAVQTDGKIIAGGTSGTQFLVLRYTTAGLLDPSFGTAGVVTIGFPGATHKGTGLVLQADGKIIITGTVRANARNYFGLVRFDRTGALDPSFGSGGGRLTALSGGHDNAYTVTLQSDGKLLMGGSAGLEGNQSMAAIRYDMSPPLPLPQWRDLHFGTTENAGNAANNFDADGDGLINLLEYAFGQIPTQAGSCAVPEGKFIGGNLVSSFAAPSTVTGITYAAEWSPAMNAESWLPVNNTGNTRFLNFSVAPGGHPKVFLRWRISIP